jgi:hypothetical protein
MGINSKLTNNIFYGKESEIPRRLPLKSAYICSDVTAIYISREDGTPFRIQSGGISDVPFDGNYYVRRNGEWVIEESNDGVDGDSAYDIWLNEGNTGSVNDFLNSLIGNDGEDGTSAYEIALNNGFSGTEEEWLESLDGFPGQDGIDGLSAYEVWLSLGNIGTEEDFIDSLKGPIEISSDENNQATIGSDGFILVPKSIPNGGLKRQVLSKNSDTNNDYSWNYRYNDLLVNVEYTGVTYTLLTGQVLEATIDNQTVFRYVTNDTNINGYPIEDSFYSNFTGLTLFNLIITRG